MHDMLHTITQIRSSKGLGFLIQSYSPLPAIWLGRDVSGGCSKKTENKICLQSGSFR